MKHYKQSEVVTRCLNAPFAADWNLISSCSNAHVYLSSKHAVESCGRSSPSLLSIHHDVHRSSASWSSLEPPVPFCPEPRSSGCKQCHQRTVVQACLSPASWRRGWWRGLHAVGWQGRLCSTSLETCSEHSEHRRPDSSKTPRIFLQLLKSDKSESLDGCSVVGKCDQSRLLRVILLKLLSMPFVKNN